MGKRDIQKGQLVTFQHGTRPVHGFVKEVRGPIGVKGRILYLVEFHREGVSPSVSHIELPADELKQREVTVPSE